MDTQHETNQVQTPQQPQSAAATAQPGYRKPGRMLIGDSRELLRGSGRHKNDDTGSRGFVVG